MIVHLKSEAINLRASAAERDLIDRAALAAGKSRSQFILDSARAAAEETLLDRSWLALDPRAWDHFVERLDAEPSQALRELLAEKAPWER